jgi:hypothetical protein
MMRFNLKPKFSRGTMAVAWVYLVFGGLSLVSILARLDDTSNEPAFVIGQVIAIALFCFAGAGLMRRRPWGYWLGLGVTMLELVNVALRAVFVDGSWPIVAVLAIVMFLALLGLTLEGGARPESTNVVGPKSPVLDAGFAEVSPRGLPPPEIQPPPPQNVTASAAHAKAVKSTKGRRNGRLRIAGIGAAIAVAGLTGYLLANGDETRKGNDEMGPAPSPVSPTPSATEPQTIPSGPPLADAEVVRGFPGRVEGRRITLQVARLGEYSQCREGEFRSPSGRYEVAYAFECSNVAGSVYEPYLLYVRLTNHAETVVRVSLRLFVVVTRDGDSQSPVNVRSDAENPEAFLSPIVVIPPNASAKGFIAFDGRLAFFPIRLSYVDQRQTLTVAFRGDRRLTA